MTQRTYKIDFTGYATKYNVGCSDGRTIAAGAFKHMDGRRVPLVWQHLADTPENIMGNVLLHSRDDGLFCEASFNSGPRAAASMINIEHGDVNGLSIFANHIVEKGSTVTHGQIVEVSVVMLGANPGAHIDDTAFAHGDESGGEAVIGWVDADDGISLIHDDTAPPPPPAPVEPDPAPVEPDPAPTVALSEVGQTIVADIKSGKIILAEAQEMYKEFFSGLSVEELILFKTALGEAAMELAHSNKSGEILIMARIFDQKADGTEENKNVLKHDQISAILAGAAQHGSLKKSFFAHAVTYGFDPITMLMPKPVNDPADPIVIQRQQEWVTAFWGGAFKSPFASVRSLYANITGAQARAKGYVKAALKTEQVITLLQRYSRPTTVYAKQAIDNDDLIDITEYAVVEFMWKVMEQSIYEELAVAGLLGDGRSVLSPDKIKEDCIRPIYKDHDFYAHRVVLPATVGGMTALEVLKMVDAVAKARRYYKGSGTPTFFTTPEFLADLITLREATVGTRYFATMAELMAQMNVSAIIEVPQMEHQIRTEGLDEHGLVGIVVNPRDYQYGNNPLGQMRTFSDFDIDYNLHKMLMETRRSGSLILPKSAIVIEKTGWSTGVTPDLPTDIDDTVE